MNRIQVKSVLNKHKRRDAWFLDDYSVNPYVGCSFNCLYCYVKGSKYGKNAGNLSAKINAPEVLEKQLRRRAKKKEYGIIAISSSTEPYMNIERKFNLTREILQVILKYKFPVHILTKSTAVLRDIDLLKEINEKANLPEDLNRIGHGTIISFSFSTLDENLAKIVEPGTPKPKERLQALQKCIEEGLLTGICFIPVLPFLSDSEKSLDKMIKTAKDYGANFVLVGALTLFGEKATDCKTRYFKFLEKYYPELIPKYEALFKKSFQPAKRYQKSLEERAKRICDKYGVKNRIIDVAISNTSSSLKMST